MNYFNYSRRKSSVVHIGNCPLGAENPIRIQSMTNTSTMDTDKSVQQAIRIIEAGADYVRLTAQGVREAENLSCIRQQLHKAGYQTPLIADIHFNPKAAEAAAKYVEKVRINPGNFVDSVKTFRSIEYTDDEYALELEKIKNKLLPFIEICREHQTAVRIGVNHGSLSDRIMSRYGDTPEGMVESCMEFLRIFIAEKFYDVVISIKSSNTLMMVKTVHLLVKKMNEEGMDFPLHLGVTEAGDGEDGRIKSAVGIGALLVDGIGDTIRVSLSEEPEFEIPVARKLVDYVIAKSGYPSVVADVFPGFDPVSVNRRESRLLKNIGGKMVPVVISDRINGDFGISSLLKPDYLYTGNKNIDTFTGDIPLIVDFPVWNKKENTYPLFSVKEINELKACEGYMKFLRISYPELSDDIVRLLKEDKSVVVILMTTHQNGLGEQRAFFHYLFNRNCDAPVIIHRQYKENNPEDIQLKSAVDFGTLFLDGFGNGIMLSNEDNSVSPVSLDSCMFGILQAVRLRTSKTEYISCPSCGRTLFDLQSAIAKIKHATSHLKGLKIGIMGCIVNGPGEMADANYGYVGSGRGKIDLYKGKICVEKNIPEENAVKRLVELIKKHGDWKE